MRKISIMSVKIGKLLVDTFTKKEVLTRIEKAIDTKHPLQVVTPYSEFVVEAEYNEKFRNAINSSELRLPDGVGILWAGSYLAKKWDSIIQSFFGIINSDTKLYSVFPEKISGSDLIYDILDIAHERKLRVYLLGGEGETPEKVQEYIHQTYPRIHISGVYKEKVREQDTTVYDMVKESYSDIVLIALSYPKQEIIASQMKQYFIKHDHKGVIMCVGGTFDFLAGVQKRAPKWMQKLGLEWLFRLIQQPGRIHRMYKATVLFIRLIYKYRHHIDK